MELCETLVIYGLYFTNFIDILSKFASEMVKKATKIREGDFNKT